MTLYESPRVVIDLRWGDEKGYFYNVQKGDPYTPHDFVPFSDEEIKVIKEYGVEGMIEIQDTTKVWNRKKRGEYNFEDWFF